MMKAFLYLLAFWLLAAPWALPAEELPIAFARGGRKVTLPIGGDDGKTDGLPALWAFGRRWSEPVTVKDGTAELVAPPVRVPVVFRLAPTHDLKRVRGELVVYPDRPLSWDKGVQLTAVGAPDWFDTWSEAVGLPVRKFKELRSLAAGNWRAPEKPGLLILGRKAAGNGPAVVHRFVAEHKINVLVLEADWFGDPAGPATVGGGQMRGDLLARTGKQSWPAMLEFRSHRQPCGALVNRWAWIPDEANLPLVEKLAVAGGPLDAVRCVVASYLPWQEQLGRRETADATLLDLLAAAANASVDGWRKADLVWPKMDERAGRQRPVLSAAADAAVAWKDCPWSAYLLDLRGAERPPDGLLPELRALEGQIGVKANGLLILGDDRLLDAWEWLKLDRAKKTSHRPGVVWLSDDELPSSTKNRIRLMLTLTELGVPLTAPGQKEEKK